MTEEVVRRERGSSRPSNFSRAGIYVDDIHGFNKRSGVYVDKTLEVSAQRSGSAVSMESSKSDADENTPLLDDVKREILKQTGILDVQAENLIIQGANLEEQADQFIRLALKKPPLWKRLCCCCCIKNTVSE